jgi:hypothetical protein
LEDFWSMIAREAHQQRNSIRNPIIQVFHSWMCKRMLGRMVETKITDMEVNWLYSALLLLTPFLQDQQAQGGQTACGGRLDRVGWLDHLCGGG